MLKKNITYIICILLFYLISFKVLAQGRTVGLFINDTTQTFKGYTLMAPNKYTATYLINNEGRLCHKWSNSQYSPGNSVYLLPNGNLLRTCKITGYISGGEGGRVEIFSWGDTLLWQFTYNTQNYISHHDVKYLPNGNILMIACEKKTIAQCLAAGFDTSMFQPQIISTGYLLPDYVIEVQPTYPSGGTIVWEWHVWDHLIQDFDSTKLNYGVVPNHPELVDCDGNGQRSVQLWNHMNSIFYNARYDQIVLSCRSNSEVWVIDHSTTTQQAAGHTGGRYGHGGDLLYRWGNPICYKLGTSANQKLFMQHDAEWIDTLCPGYGSMTVFNNGVGRNYSSSDQFIPPIDSLGFYYRAPGTAFGPSGLSWTYSPTPLFYCENISGTQRLANGNTLISKGPIGTFIEITAAGQVVWQYVNPVVNTGPLYFNDSIPIDPGHTGTLSNYVFRVKRYAPTYSAFIGKDLTPGNFIELYHVGINKEGNVIPSNFELHQNFPNPFNPMTKIKFAIPQDVKGGMQDVRLVIYDILGKEIQVLVNEKLQAGTYETTFDGSNLSTGMYFYQLRVGNFIAIKKSALIK